jgi:enterochelin esterase-like enzyme
MEASRKLPLRFYQEVGLMEGPFEIKPNHHMRDVLKSKGYPVGYFEYDGGHSFLNWAGGMERGLIFLTKRPAS